MIRSEDNSSDMKWLSAGLTFVNVSTVCGLLLGMAGHGLNKTVAVAAVLLGLAAALLAYWTTDSSRTRRQSARHFASTGPKTPAQCCSHASFETISIDLALARGGGLRHFCHPLFLQCPVH